MNTIQAAARLNVPRQQVMELIHDGAINATFMDRRWDLHEEDVEAFRLARLARQRAAFDALRELEDED